LPIVSVEMDIMIMVTLVSVVLITVLLVKIEKNVYLVQMEELKKVLIVSVTLVTMILVKKNVDNVDLNVLLVIITTFVPLVTTQL
jgi:uncharacterized membrane protein affecting hemolysin expression